jgi:hypothetical protein
MFGTLFHLGLNAWWSSRNGEPASERLEWAIKMMRSADVNAEAVDLVKAETLMAGYTARWGDEPYDTIAVEKQFRVPIVFGEIPRDGLINYDLGGAIDVIAARRGYMGVPGCETIHNLEHKTTSQDISSGADYWRNIVTLDPQVSTYDAAARHMGHNIHSTIYDVVRKPEIEPLSATPEEKKKYTKPTKAEPVPRLYASMRENDETLDEYRERLTEDIIRRPEWYFQRQEIVRLDRDNDDHARDVVQTAEMIRHATERDAWPRSPNACVRFHRLCDYHPVCSGEATIDDGTRYETKAMQHEELGQ